MTERDTTHIDTTAPQRPTSIRWIDLLLVAAGLILAGLLGAVAVRNSDIWLHLATGRSIAHGEYRFGVDPFSFTTADRYWVNHAWLFDVSIYGLLKAAGGIGVALVRTTITIGVFLVVLSIRRPGSGWAIPAVLSALALVTMNSRLPFLQPTTVSYLFLAILVALSCRGGSRMPLSVGILCAVWVNFDAWFILGPMTVALWLLGSMIRRDRQDTNISILAMTLMAALIGGLINPHHYHAYCWPDEIAPNFFADELRNELQTDPARSYRSYFERGIGDPLPHLAVAPTYTFYALLGIGIVSFGLNAAAISVTRLLIWIVFAGLAAWRWRIAPFFAVATTPLVVLNLQDFFARWDGGHTGRMMGVALRGLAVGGLTLLCLAAWPGWLGPRPDNPLRAARVNPSLVPDEALDRITKQIGQSIIDGKLKVGERIFSPSFEITPYLAWNAPGAKSFFDLRWNLFEFLTPEFLSGRRAINILGNPIEQGQQPPDPNACEPLLKKYDVTSVILTGSERGDRVGPARVFWANPDRWAFRDLAGNATWFGRLGPLGNDPAPKLRVDPVRLAFGPHVAREWPSLRTDDIESPSFWDSYLKAPTPIPNELIEGLAWSELTGTAQAEIGIQNYLAVVWWGASVASFSDQGPLHGLIAFNYPRMGFVPAKIFGRPDLSAIPAASTVLSVQQLRVAQFRDPNNPAIRLALAESYRFWPINTGWTDLQIISSLQQAKARFALAQRTNEFATARARFGIWDQLRDLHFANRQVDLGVEAAREARNLMPLVGRELFGDAVEQEYKQRSELMEEYEKQLRTLRNNFELAAERDAPMARAEKAIRVGLFGEALTILEQALSSGQPVPGFNPTVLLELLLRVGRAEEARIILHSDQFSPIAKLPPQIRGQVRALLFQASVACGDYKEALQVADDMVDEARTSSERLNGGSAAAAVAFAVTIDPIAAPGLIRVINAPIWLDAMQAQRSIGLQMWPALIQRGLIAMEAGDNQLAWKSLEEARKHRPTEVRISSQQQADQIRAWDERAERCLSLLQSGKK